MFNNGIIMISKTVLKRDDNQLLITIRIKDAITSIQMNQINHNNQMMINVIQIQMSIKKNKDKFTQIELSNLKKVLLHLIKNLKYYRLI